MNRFQKLNKVLANTNIKNASSYRKEDFMRLYKSWKRQNKSKTLKVIRREIAFRK